MGKNADKAPVLSRVQEKAKRNFTKYSEALLSLFLSGITTFFIICLGDKMSVGWAVLISVIVAAISFVVILSLKSFLEEYWTGKWKVIVGLTVIALATVPLSLLLYSQQKENKNLNNLIATQAVELTSQAENIVDAQAIHTSLTESLIQVQLTQTASVDKASATQAAQVEIIAAMQSTIDSQATQNSAPVRTGEAANPEEEIKNVIRNYFELLSNNDIDVAWDTYLTGSIQNRIIQKQGLHSYENWWENRTIKIIRFIELNFNLYKTTCWVYVEVNYYLEIVPEEYIDKIYLVWNEEHGVWLIDRFDEGRVNE